MQTRLMHTKYFRKQYAVIHDINYNNFAINLCRFTVFKAVGGRTTGKAAVGIRSAFDIVGRCVRTCLHGSTVNNSRGDYLVPVDRRRRRRLVLVIVVGCTKWAADSRHPNRTEQVGSLRSCHWLMSPPLLLTMMMMMRAFVLLLAILCLCSASRVLIVGTQVVSHLMELGHLGVSLATRGHEVWVALEEGYPAAALVAPPPLRVVHYRVPADVVRLSSLEVSDRLMSPVVSDTTTRASAQRARGRFIAGAALDNCRYIARRSYISVLRNNYYSNICILHNLCIISSNRTRSTGATIQDQA